MRVGRARLVPLTATGALVALVALGCTRANPAFIALDGGGPGQGGSGGSGGGQDSGADTNNRACSTVAEHQPARLKQQHRDECEDKSNPSHVASAHWYGGPM